MQVLVTVSLVLVRHLAAEGFFILFVRVPVPFHPLLPEIALLVSLLL